MILQAPHTHLYPGLVGTISGLDEGPGLQAERDCLVAFADGSAATARFSKSGNHWLLCTQAYRTAAGTDIETKAWRVRLDQDDERVIFRIIGKAPG